MTDSSSDTNALLALLPNAAEQLAPLHAALRGPLPSDMADSQFARHGRAWAATYVETLRQLSAYSQNMQQADRLGELEINLTLVAYGEYLNQLSGGLPMSQGEIVRPADIGFANGLPGFDGAALKQLMAHGNTAARRQLIAALILQSGTPEADAGLDDTHQMIRDQFRRFAEAEEVIPYAHDWHLKDELIPLDSVVGQMGELGVFGLTMPEEYGGMPDLGKHFDVRRLRGAIAAAISASARSGTRSEIAAELILQRWHSQGQKQSWSAGHWQAADVLPTAVFTEPNTGSDLGSPAHRALCATAKASMKVTGAIRPGSPMAARTDVMTLCWRVPIPETKGLPRPQSMFLAEKPRAHRGRRPVSRRGHGPAVRSRSSVIAA